MARDGDHLLCPFQCDLCHFRNLKGRDPLRHDYTDRNLLTAICRSNLDSFWGRASTTVNSNKNTILHVAGVMRHKYGVSNDLPYFPPQWPHPLEDLFGMFAACIMLEHSLNAGVNAVNVQFGTIRRTRSAMFNYGATTALELVESTLVGESKGVYWSFSATRCKVSGLTGLFWDVIHEWETIFTQIK
jgi:hypothetical protein